MCPAICVSSLCAVGAAVLTLSPPACAVPCHAVLCCVLLQLMDCTGAVARCSLCYGSTPPDPLLMHVLCRAALCCAVLPACCCCRRLTSLAPSPSTTMPQTLPPSTGFTSTSSTAWAAAMPQTKPKQTAQLAQQAPCSLS